MTVSEISLKLIQITAEIPRPSCHSESISSLAVLSIPYNYGFKSSSVTFGPEPVTLYFKTLHARTHTHTNTRTHSPLFAVQRPFVKNRSCLFSHDQFPTRIQPGNAVKFPSNFSNQTQSDWIPVHLLPPSGREKSRKKR